MAKKKNSIPKKVAGVKVPKTLRKSRLLRSMLGSKIGRDILASAITAGATAAAAVLVREREEIASSGKKGAKRGAHAIEVGTEAIQSAAHAAMGVVTDAAEEALPKSAGRAKAKESGRNGQAAAKH